MADVLTAIDALESALGRTLKLSLLSEGNRAAEEFAAARAAAAEEIKKSSVLAFAKEGVRSVGVGLMSALATAATAPGAEIIAASTTAGVTFLWDYVGWHTKRSERKRTRAMRAHYAVWDESRPGVA